MEALDSVFNDEAQPRDEQGRFTKGEDPQPVDKEPEPPQEQAVEQPAPEEGEPPAPEPQPEPEEPSEISGLKAGISAEREKRQKYERELEQLRAEMQRLQQANQPEPPDVYEDPDGFKSHSEKQLSQAEQQRINDRVNLSAYYAKKQHEDFDEAMQEWQKLIQQDPSLYQRAIQQESPAEWAYQQVKTQQFLTKVGDDPDKYEASLREQVEQEIREKLEAELRAKYEQQPAQPKPPRSLATAPSAPVSSQEWSGPKPLSALFGDN